MLGSGEALASVTPAQQPQMQLAAQTMAEQLSVGAQDQADNDPVSQHAGDKETDKDSSGLVGAAAKGTSWLGVVLIVTLMHGRCFLWLGSSV